MTFSAPKRRPSFRISVRATTSLASILAGVGATFLSFVNITAA
jgi:hypothetical protein